MVGEKREETTSIIFHSTKYAGKLYPVLVDRYGNVIDGMHRLAADNNWPKIKLSHIKTEEDLLIARLVANVCRRHVPAKEKRELLRKLAEIYVKQGVKPGVELVSMIVEKTGMSYRWVMKYLPDIFKKRPGCGGPRRLYKCKENLILGNVARRATLDFDTLLSTPKTRVLKIIEYVNTPFIHILIDKQFYEELKGISKALGVGADVFINNLLIWTLKLFKRKMISVPLAQNSVRDE